MKVHAIPCLPSASKAEVASPGLRIKNFIEMNSLNVHHSSQQQLFNLSIHCVLHYFRTIAGVWSKHRASAFGRLRT